MTIVFENARGYYKYRIPNWSNYLDFPKIRYIIYVKIKFSIWPHPCKVTKCPSIFLFFNIDSN